MAVAGAVEHLYSRALEQLRVFQLVKRRDHGVFAQVKRD
jgi:hypothetical protein